MVKETVDHHPFKSFEGGKNLAVVEAGCCTNEVIGWGSHHRRPDGDGGLSLVGIVVHEGPDPERAFVVGPLVVTSDHLDTELVVVGF